MKKITVFESSIIGLLVGVVVAAYTTYLAGTDGFLGNILNWISLKPIFDQLQIPSNQELFVSFVFSVIVFIIYGIIIGFLIKKISKPALLFIPLLLLATGTFFEQYNGSTNVIQAIDTSYIQTASVIKSKPITPKQYFGTEALGDLNGDTIDDIAFIIFREDKDRGTLSYVAASIADEKGHTGTNLVFLGDKVSPTSISIENETVIIDYTKSLSSTSTEKLYAIMKDGLLEKTDNPIVINTSTVETLIPEVSPTSTATSTE